MPRKSKARRSRVAGTTWYGRCHLDCGLLTPNWRFIPYVDSCVDGSWTDRRRDRTLLEKPVDKRVRARRIEMRSDVPRRPVARHRRSARQPPVLEDRDRLGTFELDPIAPQFTLETPSVDAQASHLALRVRRDLGDDDPEQLAERSRIAAEPHVVELVDDPTEERKDDDAAAAREADEIRDRRISHEVEIRRDHEPVSREIALRVNEVDGDVPFPERPVPVRELLAQRHVVRRLRRQLERPPTLPVDDERGVCGDPRADDRVEPG